MFLPSSLPGLCRSRSQASTSGDVAGWGGHSCEFVERPPPAIQWDCPLCLLVLREPHQVTCCGYSYCQACVQHVQDARGPCPTCNCTVFSTFPDKRLKRSLYPFRVYCTHKEGGCKWTGELGELEKHLNAQPPLGELLLGCQFVEVRCAHCSCLIPRCSVEDHQAEQCPDRPFACEHCQQYSSTFSDVTQSHWEVCPCFPVTCPNGCQLVLPRQSLEVHCSLHCPKSLVDCSFRSVGCTVRVAREDTSAHVSQNLLSHVALLQSQVTGAGKEDVSSDVLSLAVYSIYKLASENTSLKSKVSEDGKIIVSQASAITALESRLQQSEARLEASLTEQKRVMQEFIQQHEHRLETSLAVHGKAVQELRDSSEAIKGSVSRLKKNVFESESKQKMLNYELISEINDTKRQHYQALQSTHNIAEFTMTDFEKHKLLDDDWYSPAVYTRSGSCSYKMCLVVHANGKETGKGTHISVFAHLMRGVFDGDMGWPFQGAVTVQLLNQLEDRHHHTHCIQFSETADPRVIGRVSWVQVAGSGWGTHTFIRHSQLDLDRRVYLRENELRFRVFSGNTASCVERFLPQRVLYVTPFDFMLRDFDFLKRQQGVWTSPVFYSHLRGYRMCLCVYPNGRGIGRGTHTSLSIAILQGPFDAALNWPFRGSITVQVVNQISDNNHHEKIISNEDRVSDNAAGRVADARNPRRLGCEGFLQHCVLEYDETRQTHYLKNDSLRIRICRIETDR